MGKKIITLGRTDTTNFQNNFDRKVFYFNYQDELVFRIPYKSETRVSRNTYISDGTPTTEIEIESRDEERRTDVPEEESVQKRYTVLCTKDRRGSDVNMLNVRFYFFLVDRRYWYIVQVGLKMRPP